MPNLAMISAFVLELASRRTLPREPEPDLVMDGADQVAAYAIAGRHPSGMSAVGIFHAARISSVLRGCKAAIDLGCGPGTQLARVAELNPEIQFTGIDLSERMLDDARGYISERGLSNVRFVKDDITRLSAIADHSTDAVISTVALHHLPSADDLRKCFQQIRRVLKPGGALYLADLTRPKSVLSAALFAYTDRGHQPHLFLLDYERSLRAAFTFDEFKTIALQELSPGLDLDIRSTFLVPLFAVIKTADHELAPEQRQRLETLRAELPPRYRRDLDDLRRFFRLGGLKGNPFR